MARRIGAALAVAALFGCGDSPAGLADDEGLLAFDYSGVAEGSFVARGGSNIGRAPEDDYAEGLTRPGRSGFQAGAHRPGGNLDALILFGSYQLAPARTIAPCNPPEVLEQCFIINLWLNLGPESEGYAVDWLYSHSFPDPAVFTITEATATRVKGTFSMVLTKATTGEKLTIRNGRFDLPVRDAPDLQ